MKVLFIKRNLDRSELELTLALHARGVDILVMTLETSVGVDQLKDKGIYVKPRPYASKINWPLIRQLRALVREQGITVLHAPESKSLSNAILATYFMPVKIVAYRGTQAKIRKTDISYWLGILNPRVDRIICVNQSVYDYLLQFFPAHKLLVNHKGYDPSWNSDSADSLPALPPLPEHAFVVMYIADAKGRPYKGLDILIDAMHQTSSTKIHLVFIGSFDQHSKNRADAGPARDRIHLPGPRPNAARYLKQAQLFVLPSTRDGLPRVIKEAMADALPVVCTDIPGPTDLVIHQQTGLLVEPGSPAALRDAIETLYQNPELRKKLGEGGKQHLLTAFSADAFADKTLSLYRELCPK